MAALCLLGALTSCGDSKSAGTGELKTVFVTAAPPATSLDSDVQRWFEANGTTKATPCAGFPFISPDDVRYSITSEGYPSSGTNTTVASRIQVTGVTLTLTPYDSDSPALPASFATQSLSSGQVVLPNTTQTVVLRVVSHELKEFFTSGLGSLSINCAASEGAIYRYWANITFDVTEVDTNTSAKIQAGSFLVRIADFGDTSS